MTHSTTRPTTLAFLALAAAFAPTAAQEPLGDEVNRCICPDRIVERVGDALSVLGPRARLGVYLGDTEREDGRLGVRLSDVPDGSPAHRAGLRSGDLVLSLDGMPLGDEPGRSLRRRMADVEPGDTVEVGYLRDGRERQATVVPEAASGPVTAFRLGERDLLPRFRGAPGGAGFRLERGPGGAFVFRTGEPAIELAPLNPSLGRYFEADRGVLVLDVPEGSPLGLQPGDVILGIDGREIRDPDHAHDILESYRSDETITLRIIREGREREVEGQAR